MLSLSPATRVFLATQPIDGRKSFNGLSVLVKESKRQRSCVLFSWAEAAKMEG
jgi:hypothetical protein